MRVAADEAIVFVSKRLKSLLCSMNLRQALGPNTKEMRDGGGDWNEGAVGLKR